MPVDDAFALDELAILYDSFNQPGADNAFYLALPERPCRILDIGCGTGTLALSLAESGHQVVGLEPGRGMLAVAQAKDQARAVEWIEGNALDFQLNGTFDLIVMTGHVFQVFLSDEEMRAVLANARRHLSEGGRLVFESRNPLHASWTGWTEERTRRREMVPAVGEVEVFYQVKDVDGELVRFDAVFTILSTGERRISESTLRFPSRERIEELLADSGFSFVDWLGDWDGSAFTPESREIIAIARAK